ncbi:MAG: chloride channel protein [Magnetospirillum sp.]|nr:chloride channel protein [Magnetospirillum sp.]
MGHLHFRRRLLLAPRLWLRRVAFWIGAVAISLVAIAFAKAANVANDAFHVLIHPRPAMALLVTPLGLGLALWMTRRFFPGSEGSGIPQAIAALEMTEAASRQAVLSLRIAAGKILLTLLALCSGASVGREGPTAQIGSSIMHAVGQSLRLSHREVQRALILAGGAAGVAAAFNTPLAGVVFAIEELSRSFEERTSGTVFSAVILAGIASLAILGNYHYFGHTAASLSLGRGWVAVFVCGGIGGLAGGVFSQSLILAARHGLPGPLGRLKAGRPVAFAVGCGLVLAVIGLLTGSATYGTGYDEAQTLLHGASLPDGFALAKIAATIVSYLSGIPGGIFAPSLAAGAGIGADVAKLLPMVPAGAVILLGMVAYFAGVVQAPITAVVIVLEMTDNNEMTIPLMASALVAFGASRLLCPEPFYKALAQNFLGKVEGKSAAASPQ